MSKEELGSLSSERPASSSIRILVVEDTKSDMEFIEKRINKGIGPGPAIELVHMSRVADALDHLTKDYFDAVVLDLSVPDSQGIESIKRINQCANVPIIALTKSEDDAFAIEVLKAGAEDYLVKDRITLQVLYRVIRYAIARHQRIGAFQTLSLVDELTGLYNRRGFTTLAEQQIKVARRENLGTTMAFADVDGLKSINDQFGHSMGDLALKDAATVLKSTFRESDVVARIGGDEFVVFWTRPTAVPSETLLMRLKSNMDTYSIGEKRSYSLSLSIGVTHYAGGFTESLTEMLNESDRQMYQHKRRLIAGQ